MGATSPAQRKNRKIKSQISQKMYSSSCKDQCAKIVKLKTIYMKDCITQGDRISLNLYISLGEGEGGQASSSEAVINTAGLRRCSSKPQVCYLRRRRGGEQERQPKYTLAYEPLISSYLQRFLINLTLINLVLFVIGSLSNYPSLLYQWISIQ